MLASMLASGMFAAVLALPIGIASAHDCPQGGCPDGRMTGGGRLDTELLVTHGFELHCNIEDEPNNLQVNWQDETGENHFHLESLGYVNCFDNPNIDPKPPVADFDLLESFGYGKLNNEDGAKIYFRLTDAGEPGVDDYARFKIQDPDDNIVLDVIGNLEHGNHQAH
jgi:hypothetical protein